jgi:hypothetical protein
VSVDDSQTLVGSDDFTSIAKNHYQISIFFHSLMLCRVLVLLPIKANRLEGSFDRAIF